MSFFAKVNRQEEFLLPEGVQTLQIQGFNGSISWEPLDGGAGRIVAEKEVSSLSARGLEQILAELRVEDESTPGKKVLRAVKPSNMPLLVNCKVAFTIYASSEQIMELQAQTSNGAIRLEAPFTGKMNLRTSNGRIQLREGQGEVEATTSNGRIEFGKLQLQGTSSLRTSNGRIEGQVEFSQEGRYSFETSNGAIELRVPRDTPGSFRAKSSNGQIEFNLEGDHAIGRKEVSIQRSPRPSVTLATSNGAISVIGY